MTAAFTPRLAPVRHPATGARLGVRRQIDLLRWQLPMPFTLRDLAHEIGRQIEPRNERHAGSLAEMVIRDWLRRGAIKRINAAGLPRYARSA